MGFQASIHDLHTGRFLLHCSVEARNLHEAENEAIARGAHALRANPQDVEVRRLHQQAWHPAADRP
jgi:hypothetical protein